MPAISSRCRRCRSAGRAVLSTAKLSPGQEASYEASVARGLDDYDAGRGESPGVWHGTRPAPCGRLVALFANDRRAPELHEQAPPLSVPRRYSTRQLAVIEQDALGLALLRAL